MLAARQRPICFDTNSKQKNWGRSLERRLGNLLSLHVVLAVLVIATSIFIAHAASAEEFGDAFLSSLTVTGFAQNTTAAWTNPGANRQTHSSNALAAERNLLQIDVNDKPTQNDQLFVRFWLVYEPPYAVNGADRARKGQGAKNAGDFYNDFAFRDAWWEHTAGPLHLYTGRQIVTWGESISFRVCDVVNPTDTSYAFGFANLEQSRLAIFMVHPILNLPNVGPLTSNYVEGIFAPGIDDQWTHVDYVDDRYEGQNTVAGRVNILAVPLGRFGARAETKLSGFRFWNLSATAPTKWKIPPVTPENFQEGIRLHTLLGETEMAALFWHSHQYSPTFFRTQTPKGNGLRALYPDYMATGATFDRPIYLAQYLPTFVNKAIEGAPFVVRGEGLYLNHAPYDSVNPLVSHNRAMSVIYSDTFNYMLALDLDQASAPWLTSTGTITANLEYQSLIILSQNKWMVPPTYSQRPVHRDTNLLFNIGTSWYWGVIAPTWTNIYNPQGNTFLLFPSIVLTPPWTNRYFATIKYIGILGSNRWSPGGGLLKGQSLILAQFQYNWNANELFHR